MDSGNFIGISCSGRGSTFCFPGYMQVPGFWKHANENGDVNSQGAVTYRLKIKLEPSATMYGLRISNIRMASEIYVNGNRVGGSGKPAESESLYTYENKPFNAFLRYREIRRRSSSMQRIMRIRRAGFLIAFISGAPGEFLS